MNASGSQIPDENADAGEVLYWFALFAALASIIAHNVVTSPFENQGQLFVAGYFLISVVNYLFGKAMFIGILTVKRDGSLFSRIIRPFGACLSAYVLSYMYLK